jgi:hypothetical protein
MDIKIVSLLEPLLFKSDKCVKTNQLRTRIGEKLLVS